MRYNYRIVGHGPNNKFFCITVGNLREVDKRVRRLLSKGYMAFVERWNK